MRSRDTEPRSRADKRRSRVSDYHDRDLALEHLVRKGRHLGWVVQHNGDNGTVVVAVDDETETLQAEAQIPRIEA